MSLGLRGAAALLVLSLLGCTATARAPGGFAFHVGVPRGKMVLIETEAGYVLMTESELRTVEVLRELPTGVLKGLLEGLIPTEAPAPAPPRGPKGPAEGEI